MLVLPRSRWVCSLLCLAALTTVRAGPTVDLDRETPVPATEQIPIGDFFRPSVLAEPLLNASGTHIAAIVTAGADRHQLMVYELKTKKIEGIVLPGDRDIYAVSWLTDKRVMFQVAARKMYGVALMAADIGALSSAYPLLQYYSSAVVGIPTRNRLRPLVWNRFDALESGTRNDLGVSELNTDLQNGRLADLLGPSASMEGVMYVRADNQRHIVKTYPVPGGGLTVSYVTDKDGELTFAQTSQDGALFLQRLDSNRWVPCPVNLEEIDVIGAGDLAGQLAVLGPWEEGKPRPLQFMDGATGHLGEVLMQDAAYDFFGSGTSHGWVYREPVDHRVIGAIFDRAAPAVVWFSEEYRMLQKILDGYFPGQVVRIISTDEGQKIFLVATFSDRQPVTYHWVDLEQRSFGLIKRSAPWIDPNRMQPMSVMKFKTRDGHRLDAYLTLPAGASKARPAPVVILPHGGPWARDTWGFNGEVQFLASRGYAVLQPNYRGSNGYSWMFPATDRWDFAKMHDDVTDATTAVLATGLVDRDRVAIMGGSFGGYLALSGVVNEPALYRCAVAIAGVFDWAQQIQDKKYDQYDSFVFGYLMRRLGDPNAHPEKFDAISPGRHVDRIRVPVFVSGGKDDQTVDIGQSRTLLSALEKHHVPHESYLVGGEGHGMARVVHQVELYSRIERFLAANLASPKAMGGAEPAH